MKKHRKQNLITLAQGLMNDHARHGTQFSMWTFASSGNSAGTTECGSVGCAVGHAPFYGIEKFADERWDVYSHRTLLPNSKKWMWCFSGSWGSVDNSKLGAAQRIIYMLQYGMPTKWDYSHRTVELYNHIEGFCEYWLKENVV